MTFSGDSEFGKCFGASSQSNHWAGHIPSVKYSPLFITCHNLIEKQFTAVVQNKMTLQNNDFFDLQLMRHLLIKLFHLSNLLQMPNDWRMVDAEFSDNFSCSFKRVGFNDPLNWSLSTSHGRPLCSSSSRLSSPLQNLLNHHCTACLLGVPEPNASSMLQVLYV